MIDSQRNSLVTCSFTLGCDVTLTLLNGLLLLGSLAPVLGQKVLGDRVPEPARLLLVLLLQWAH